MSYSKLFNFLQFYIILLGEDFLIGSFIFSSVIDLLLASVIQMKVILSFRDYSAILSANIVHQARFDVITCGAYDRKRVHYQITSKAPSFPIVCGHNLSSEPHLVISSGHR